MTTLVVDGYNAIYAIPVTRELIGESLDRARKEILAISRKYARSSGYITDVKIVFDGDDRYRGRHGRDISRDAAEIYSRTGSGDDKIIETVQACSRRGRVVLASNDNYVRNNARGYGASLINPEKLYDEKRNGPAGRYDRIPGDICDRITREYMEELGL